MCCCLCSFDGPGGAGDYSEDEQLEDPDETQVRVCECLGVGVHACMCVSVCTCRCGWVGVLNVQPTPFSHLPPASLGWSGQTPSWWVQEAHDLVLVTGISTIPTALLVAPYFLWHAHITP